MAFWGQNAGNVNPREGIGGGWSRNDYPRSQAVYGPQLIVPGGENPGSTLPSDGWSARPNRVNVDVSYGDHDALNGRLMAVAQADLYDASPNPFPACGVYDQPGAWHGIIPLIRLQSTTSAHPGLSWGASGGNPSMLFKAPPAFGQQTRPIYAIGL